jgi:hypothetical protein
MEYQNTAEDELLFEKIDREQREMILEHYGIKHTDPEYPKEPYLLNPKNLFLSSFEQFPGNNTVILNIRYSRVYKGYVTDNVRMNYNQYILGKIYCDDVQFIKKVKFNPKGTIYRRLFSKSKILNLPLKNSYNLKIKCQNIRADKFNIFTKDSDGSLILDEVFRANLKNSLDKNSNPFTHE